MKGQVRWFNNRKGYGFIGREDGGRDLFVHYTGIEKEGYKTLKPKQTVEFDVVEGPKGEQAGNVKVLKEPEELEVETKESEVETKEEN